VIRNDWWSVWSAWRVVSSLAQGLARGAIGLRCCAREVIIHAVWFF
jgi:hypothetical protein